MIGVLRWSLIPKRVRIHYLCGEFYRAQYSGASDSAGGGKAIPRSESKKSSTHRSVRAFLIRGSKLNWTSRRKRAEKRARNWEGDFSAGRRRGNGNWICVFGTEKASKFNGMLDRINQSCSYFPLIKHTNAIFRIAKSVGKVSGSAVRFRSTEKIN